MNEHTPLETERKFLIAMPEDSFLQGATEVWEMTQTYLTTDGGEGSRRVRAARNRRGETVYTYTAKQRKTPMTCIEDEKVIDARTTERLLCEARQDSCPVVKTRYVIPYAGHRLEIDRYPFWGDTAVLEVELAAEEEEILFPPEITVLREVTEEGLYKNTSIAKWLYRHPGTPLPTEAVDSPER